MSIINQTRAEMQRRADETDDQKRAFEKSLKRSALALLNKIAAEFAVFYAATGDMLNANEYESELTAILRNSYRRTSSFFKNDYKRLIQEAIDDGNTGLAPLLEERDGVSKEINASVLLFILSRAKNQSSLITNTTNKIALDSIGKVTTQATLDGITLTNEQVAKEAGKIIKDKNKGRATLISETEVQAVAEGSKDIEVVKLDDELQRQREIKRISKTWITMFDKQVRAAHQAANGQKKGVQEPYIVGGELLKHPGDTSFGASAGNTINCRCISITS